MEKENFIALLYDALELEEIEINLDDVFREYNEWDSLSMLTVLATINEEYDIIIPRKIFDKMVTVEDIFLYLDKELNM